MTNYQALIEDAQVELKELEASLNHRLQEFKKETGLPVYLILEDIEEKTIGGKSVVHQTFKAKIVL